MEKKVRWDKKEAVACLRRWNVRDSHQNKLSPLPEQQGSKKRQEKEWGSELVMPQLWQAVCESVSK